MSPDDIAVVRQNLFIFRKAALDFGQSTFDTSTFARLNQFTTFGYAVVIQCLANCEMIRDFIWQSVRGNRH
jgi:hypothetical protein